MPPWTPALSPMGNGVAGSSTRYTGLCSGMRSFAGTEWNLLHPLSPDPLATALALEILLSLQQPVGCRATQLYPLPVPTACLPGLCPSPQAEGI